MEENEYNYGEMAALMAKIVYSMELSKEKQDTIDKKKAELEMITVNKVYEEKNAEVDELMADKKEFDEMTENALLKMKKDILIERKKLDEENAAKYQEFSEKYERITSKSAKIMERIIQQRDDRVGDRISKVEENANRARKDVDEKAKEWKTKYEEKRNLLNTFDDKIQEFAIDLGILGKLDEIKLEEPKKEEPKRVKTKKAEPKRETERVEPKRVEPKKVEPKRETEKVEPKRVEPKKVEPKRETEKVELKRVETKKVEPKREAEKVETKKIEKKKTEPKTAISAKAGSHPYDPDLDEAFLYDSDIDLDEPYEIPDLLRLVPKEQCVVLPANFPSLTELKEQVRKKHRMLNRISKGFFIKPIQKWAQKRLTRLEGKEISKEINKAKQILTEQGEETKDVVVYRMDRLPETQEQFYERIDKDGKIDDDLLGVYYIEDALARFEKEPKKYILSSETKAGGLETNKEAITSERQKFIERLPKIEEQRNSKKENNSTKTVVKQKHSSVRNGEER